MDSKLKCINKIKSSAQIQQSSAFELATGAKGSRG